MYNNPSGDDVQDEQHAAHTPIQCLFAGNMSPYSQRQEHRTILHFCTRAVTTNHGTSLSMDCKYGLRICPPSPPIKVCLTSPPLHARRKRRLKQRTEEMVIRQVWEKSESVTREPSKLAKQPNNRKTVANIIYPREKHTNRPCHCSEWGSNNKLYFFYINYSHEQVSSHTLWLKAFPCKPFKPWTL